MAYTREGVPLDRVWVLGNLICRMVRVPNPQRLTDTQILVEYAPPGCMYMS